MVDRCRVWESHADPVISDTLDSQLMEGITYHERSALGVSLDIRPTEGVPCLERRQYPERSTYGGDYLTEASGSGGVPGQ